MAKGKSLEKLSKAARREQRAKDQQLADNIDWWKEPEFDEKDVTEPFLEESDFKILFPEYRSQYIQETWQAIKKILGGRHLKAELDVVGKFMSVATTGKTFDPFVIIKARDMLKLIARGVPVSHAKRILDQDCHCDIIKIGGIVRNKERFARRRQRLIGPNGSTLKVIELLTNSYVCVSGQTVSALGPWKGLKKVRKIVLDCMKNIHPVYTLKTLMVQKELEKNPEMQEADWERYLPHFKKPSHKRKPHKQPKEESPSSSPS